ncbi:MAG: beta-lactamase family protein [Bacteroidetes bacterium]|nr:beta-lactamase family protein [Bacteroidota bacterium]
MKIQKAFLLLFVTPLFFSTSCDKPVIKNKEIHFDEFAAQLEESFGPACVGFQYAIAHKGQLKEENAIGKAILAIDGDETDYNLVHRKSVHSMTKTITAAGMMKALNSNNISLDASIAPYLPDRWELVPEVDNITFREILQHKSGLRGTKDTYESMRTYMETGGFEAKNVSVSAGYANVNYTLMRLLIPMVNPIVNDALNTTLNEDGAEAFDYQAAQGYIAYIRNTVLIPAGIDEEVGPYIWDGNEEDATRNYNFANQSLTGYTHPDGTLITGAGAWYMNANDYSAFLAFLLHGELDGIDHQTMIDNDLGMFTTTYGSLETIDHNGAFTDASGRGGRAQWIHIPTSDVTVVVQINSANNGFTVGEMKTMILDAYLDSYY